MYNVINSCCIHNVCLYYPVLKRETYNLVHTNCQILTVCAYIYIN